jgi:putative ABC transport system substrate-binding protein
MKRREFVTLLGGAAATWPLATHAQQPAMPVVGLLNVAALDSFASRFRSIRQGLNEAGYVEGRNVAIEYHGADEQSKLPALAADLVRRRVNTIVALGIPAVFAAKAATTDIPIVFNVGLDPVEIGLVASLNRPGGNLTGVSNLNAELAPKQLEVLREVVPGAKGVALLVNPANAAIAEPLTRRMREAARTLGIELRVLNASTERDVDAVFVTLGQLRASALIISSDSFFNSRSEYLAALAIRHTVPALHQFRGFAAAGGLVSCGSNIADADRRAGIYAGRILKGEQAAEMPIEQATKVELVLNVKTAKALGLTFPLSLLGRADEVIE